MTKPTKIKKQPEKKQEKTKNSKPTKKKWWLRMLVYLFILGIVLQSFFYFLATPFLKEFIQNKIKKDSDGLYELYFDHLTIDFTGNNVFLTGFHLKPNKERYKELLQKQQVKKPLYEIELTALLIYDINIFESFTKPGISIEHIDIVQPDFKVVDAPNKKIVKKSKFNYDIFHQDLYPAINTYVTALKVENINLTEGQFDLTRIKNKNSSSKAKKVSINMHNFAVDSLSAVKHDRLFYSEKIDLKIENYSMYLTKMHHFMSIDSIRIITNKEIAIHNTKLRPDTLNININDTLKSIINADIPLFKLIKPNSSDIYFKKIINIEKILIESPKLIIKELYKKSASTTLGNPKQKRNLATTNLYIFIEDYFNSIKIKEFQLQKAKTQITFAKSSKPNIDIPEFSMNLINFELDSNSFYKKNNFFYCDNFEFNGNNIDVALNTSNYNLKMKSLLLSTFQKKIAISDMKLSNNQTFKKTKSNTLFDVSFKFMSATGIDFLQLYNKHELQLTSLNLADANIKIDKFTKEKSDLEEIKSKNLKKKILNKVILGNLNLSNTTIEFNEFRNNILQNEFKINISTQLSNFKHFPHKKDSRITTDFLDFSSFNVNITKFYFKSKELNYQTNIDYLSMSTQDSSFRLRNLALKFDTAQNSLARLKKLKKNGYLNLEFPHISINKLNIRDLIYNKKLMFGAFKIIDPEMFYLAYNHLNFVNIGTIDSSLFSFKPTEIKANTCKEKLTRIRNHFALNEIRIQKFPNLKKCNFCAFIDSIKANRPVEINPKQGLIAQAKVAKYDSTELFKTIEKLPIFANLKKHFDIIKFQKFNLVNANLEIIEKDSINRKNFYLKNKTSLAIHNFKLKPDSIIQTYENLFSDSIKVVFNSQILEIPNSIYKLRAKKIGFSFPENTLFGSNIYIYEKEKAVKKQQIEKFYNLIIPEFHISGFDIKSFNKHKRLDLNKIYFKNPNISQIIKLDYLKPDTTKVEKDNRKIADLLKLKLPKSFSAITFVDLTLDSASFLVANEKNEDRKFTLRSDFSFNISDFMLDSLIIDSIPDYNYVSNISLDISNLEKSLADSIHTLNIENMRFSMDTSDIRIKNISLTAETDTAIVNFKNLRRLKVVNLLNLKIPSITIKNIDLHQLYYQNKLEIDSLKIRSSDLEIERFPLISKILEKKKIDINELDLFQKITPKLNSIQLNNFNVNNIHFFAKKDDDSDTIAFSGASLSVKNLNIDSLSKKSEKILYNDDISIKIPNFHYSLNQFYKIKFDSLCLSSNKEKMRINGFVMKPRLNREEFGRLKYYQTGINDFAVTQIEINQFNFKKLLKEKAIDIGHIDIDQSRLHNYKDFRLPFDSSVVISMPLTLLYNAKNQINIDSITLSNMTFKYEESVKDSKVDSRILIENINTKITNLTNSKEALLIHDTATVSVNGLIMGKGFFNADFTFLLGAYNNEYSYEGYIKPFYLTNLNNYLINSQFVKIPRGKLDKIKFNIIANDDYAYGKVRFLYHALKIEVLDKNVEEGEANRRAMLSFFANGLLQSSNPRYPGTPPRMGRVYFERNPQKQIFNYWILSILSGIKSTIGLTPRKAKKVLKEKKSILEKLKFVD